MSAAQRFIGLLTVDDSLNVADDSVHEIGVSEHHRQSKCAFHLVNAELENWPIFQSERGRQISVAVRYALFNGHADSDRGPVAGPKIIEGKSYIHHHSIAVGAGKNLDSARLCSGGFDLTKQIA